MLGAAVKRSLTGAVALDDGRLARRCFGPASMHLFEHTS